MNQLIRQLLVLISFAVLVSIVRAQSLPPDLPLAASPPSTQPWLRTANILQPTGHSQYVALLHLGDRPQRLKKDFGFNVIVVLPTDAHNALSGPADQLTDQQFRAGCDAYRKAGYHIILYTSIEGMGCAPEFQSGQIAREHPEWAQRDPKGNSIMVYGQPWLCPSTGARQAALERCVKMVQDYAPDGILLDNSEFYFTDAGWTCHCQACTAGFRQYLQERNGAELTKQLFGAAPQDVQIPSSESPLFSMWMRWRDRLWANAVESFRARLRQIDPHIMLLANTQYYFPTGALAADAQYTHEDVIISESVGLGSAKMSDKMMLGHAVAEGRPLWNYIGTFVNGEDYTGMKPASVIGPMIAATLAHGARPWVVDGFDLGATNAAARTEMARLLGWHATHEVLYQGEPWAQVGTLISLTSRDVLHRPVIPPVVSALREAGVPQIALRDNAISDKALEGLRVLAVQASGCLSGESAEVLAKWVRSGGTLIAADDTGMYDQLGRKREHSVLWNALGLEGAPQERVAVGQGKVLSSNAQAFAASVLNVAGPMSLTLEWNTGIEVVSYRAGHDLVLHIVRHAEKAKAVTLRVPEEFQASGSSAQLLVPGLEAARDLPLSRSDGRTTLQLPDPPLYCVVKIACR